MKGSHTRGAGTSWSCGQIFGPLDSMNMISDWHQVRQPPVITDEHFNHPKRASNRLNPVNHGTHT